MIEGSGATAFHFTIKVYIFQWLNIDPLPGKGDGFEAGCDAAHVGGDQEHLKENVNL